MNFVKNSGQSLMKLNDIQPINKKLKALIRHHCVENLKKLKQVSSFFFKSSGLSFIKFNDMEAIIKQLIPLITLS